ncbi:MAG: ATP-binding protein [Parcubacteria group bacterium]|jgi:PAS domain S-box-containing protein
MISDVEEKLENKCYALKEDIALSAAEVRQLQQKLTTSNNLLQKRHYELEALKALSAELADVIELWQAIDLVNAYLWEIIDYSVAAYIIFDATDDVFNSRVYLKEAASTGYLTEVKKTLITYIAQNAQAEVASIAQAYIDEHRRFEMAQFGVPVSFSGVGQPNSGFVIPLGIGDKMLGALHISSSKSGLYETDGEQELVRSMASIASISIARLQELISSQHSMNESLVESLNNGVIMFNNQQKIILMNPAAQKMTGLMNDDYSVTELFSLFPDIKLESMIRESIETGQVMHVEEANVSMFFYEMYISPVRDSKKKIVGGAIIIHDVTHLKEVDRMKTDFVSIASHQLRTPLTTISWYTEMLQSGNAGELNEKQRDYLAEVHNSGVRMMHLVNDLLNISRLETGRLKVDPRPVDLVKFIVDVIHDLEIWSKDKGCLVVFEKPKESSVVVAIDNMLTDQVLHNLITNAVRYSTEENNHITISLIEKENEYWIAVADGGIGIPQKERDKIFQKFFRADNARVKVGDGSGIGLYIAKMIMEAAAGRLWFESPTLKREGSNGSVEEYGTTFYMAIPKSGMLSHEGEKTLKS